MVVVVFGVIREVSLSPTDHDSTALPDGNQTINMATRMGFFTMTPVQYNLTLRRLRHTVSTLPSGTKRDASLLDATSMHAIQGWF